jgi:hypothetical protein
MFFDMLFPLALEHCEKPEEKKINNLSVKSETF